MSETVGWEGTTETSEMFPGTKRPPSNSWLSQVAKIKDADKEIDLRSKTKLNHIHSVCCDIF